MRRLFVAVLALALIPVSLAKGDGLANGFPGQAAVPTGNYAIQYNSGGFGASPNFYWLPTTNTLNIGFLAQFAPSTGLMSFNVINYDLFTGNNDTRNVMAGEYIGPWYQRTAGGSGDPSLYALEIVPTSDGVGNFNHVIGIAVDPINQAEGISEYQGINAQMRSEAGSLHIANANTIEIDVPHYDGGVSEVIDVHKGLLIRDQTNANTGTITTCYQLFSNDNDNNHWLKQKCASGEVGVWIEPVANVAIATDKSGILTAPTTVATLPTCDSTHDGERAFVSDANATTFASIVAGAGSNHIPVYCDGSGTPHWRIG